MVIHAQGSAKAMAGKYRRGVLAPAMILSLCISSSLAFVSPPLTASLARGHSQHSSREVSTMVQGDHMLIRSSRSREPMTLRMGSWEPLPNPGEEEVAPPTKLTTRNILVAGGTGRVGSVVIKEVCKSLLF